MKLPRKRKIIGFENSEKASFGLAIPVIMMRKGMVRDVRPREMGSPIHQTITRQKMDRSLWAEAESPSTGIK
jgi:hypothetical protein